MPDVNLVGGENLKAASKDGEQQGAVATVRPRCPEPDRQSCPRGDGAVARDTDSSPETSATHVLTANGPLGPVRTNASSGL